MATLKTFTEVGNYALGQPNCIYVPFSSSNETVIGENELIRVFNASSSTAVMRIGPPGTNTATTSDIFLAPNTAEVFEMGLNTSVSVDGTTGNGVSILILARS
jgi:hypothetical protein